MSKVAKFQDIKEIFQKPEPGRISIFIQPDPTIKKKLYKSIPAGGNLELIVLDEAEAESIHNSLTSI